MTILASPTGHPPRSAPGDRIDPAFVRARVRDFVEVLNTPFRFVQDAMRFPHSERRMSRRIDALLHQGSPVVVYSAPKTASTSIAAALTRTAGLSTVKVHFVQPEHFWLGPLQSKTAPDGLLRHRAIEQRPSRRMLFASDMPLRIVSVVRDPIAFNLSNYTFFGRAYWMRTFWRSAPWIDTDRIMGHFLRTFPHDSSSLWWQREFAPTTGIDIAREGFDAERGWQRYRNGRFDCLVIRSDIADDDKQTALAEWTGMPVSKVERENANDTQSAPGVYERMKAAVAGERAYVERMLALPAAQMFFNAKQREALAGKWLGAHA